MASIKTLAWLLLAALIAARAGAAEGIAWRSDPEEAKREAAGSRRLVLLHFSGTYCPPCRKMEHEVFSRPDVGQAVERDYVPVAVDVEKNQPLSQQYGVRKIPCDVIVLPNGTAIQKMEGAKSAQDYMAALSRVAQVARGAAPALGQNGPSGPLPQTPGAVPPWGAGPGRDGAPPPTVGQLQPNPFAPRVGQQYTLEAGPSPPGGIVPPPNPNLPSQGFAPPGQPPVPPPITGGAANQGGNAPPPWSNLGTGVAPPNAPPLSSEWLTPAPPPGASPFGGNGAIGQPPTGAAPRGPASQPNLPGQAWPPNPPPQFPQLPPLGFDGFCPVTMFHQERWALGDRRWGVIHEGRLYLFASPEAKEAFFRDPNRYAPVFSGNDVVAFVESGQRVPGQIRIGAKYPPDAPTQRMFLFASEESFQRFNANPPAYLERLRQMLSGGATGPLNR